MTPQETAELLDMVADQFPHARHGERALMLYHAGLQDLVYAGVQRALIQVLRTSQYPPTVHELRKAYYRDAGVLDAEEAWDALMLTIRSGDWQAYQRHEPLTLHAANAVGGISALRTTEYPALLRKDFLSAYSRAFERELAEPTLTLEALGSGHDDTEAERKLAGASKALGSGQATGGGR